jgi:hypothetical protein
VTETKPRRLAVVECRTVMGQPDGIHLSVEEWEPKFSEWVTSLALCGQSAEQGALDPTTPVTCRACEGHRDHYERALSGRPTVEQEQLAKLDARWKHWKQLATEMETDRDLIAAQLDLATEFHIPCPEAADPGRPEGAPVLQPEPLIVQKATANWADLLPDGWRIFNPNLDMGDHVWTGDGWLYSGKLHMRVIYRWTRDEAITVAQRLAPEETRRFEKWIAEMREQR